MRRALAATVVLLPAATALATVRPVAASAPEPFGSYGLTVTAAALRSDGVLGASGGLVTLDAGVAYTSGRLDGGPSSFALGAPVEPGTLARTVVGEVNNQAGTTVLTVPDAQAAYPGQGSASTSYAPPQAAGPLTVTPGTATSSAGPHQATSATTGSAVSLAGGAQAARLAASFSLSGAAETGQGEADGSSRVGSLEVAGVLALQDVVAQATVVVTGGRARSSASLTVGAATVAGVPVTVDQDGVHVLGQGVGSGPLAAAQEQVDQALAGAGVSVKALGVTHTVTGRTAYADTGGLLVQVRTPDLSAGVAGNTLDLTVGKVTLTGTSTALEPFLQAPVPSVPTGVPATGGASTTTTVTGGGPALSTAPVAPPAPSLASQTGAVLVAGRRMSAALALAAFGVWQLLSLSTMTLYAFVDRRRRLEEGA